MTDMLDRPLLRLSKRDAWTVRDACEGVAVLGATGSGKTTGSGEAIAKAFLRAGFGGLVLCVKPDERRLWERYAEQTGRAHHLVVFGADAKYRFNFLDYELNRAGAGGGFTENLVSLFVTAAEVTGGQNRQGSNDAYWQQTLKQLLRNAIELVAIANGRVTLAELYAVIAEAPQDLAAVRDEAWQQTSRCWACLERAHGKAEAGDLPEGKRQDFDLTARYWLAEFPALADKTRSIIVSMFTSMADGLLRSPMRELFCSGTNIVPELAHEGAVILVDLPVLEFAEIGQMAQVLWKLLFQKATERRDITKHPLPVFLWADEAQYFITRNDAVFQTTARAARCCTVMLSQNLPNYVAAMGGDRMRIDSLMGNMQTKIFHANADSVTNLWAAELIARDAVMKASMSRNNADGKTDGQSSGMNLSESYEFQVQPIAFTRLRKGGPENGFDVEAIVFQAGRRWSSTGTTHLQVRFTQHGTSS